MNLAKNFGAAIDAVNNNANSVEKVGKIINFFDIIDFIELNYFK
jgi:hypothetical protein